MKTRNRYMEAAVMCLIYKIGKVDEIAQGEYVSREQLSVKDLSIPKKLGPGRGESQHKDQEKRSESRGRIGKEKNQRNQGSHFSNECKQAQRRNEKVVVGGN